MKAALDSNTEHAFTVNINEEKPRRGSFVISVEGKNAPVVELLGLVRPFQKLD